MSSTTKKFREFMAEPIGDKGIRDVPGIGDVLGTKLSEAGYDKVCFSLLLVDNEQVNSFCSRPILYLVNIYCVIKISKNFKIGFKHNAVPIVIKQKQQLKHFQNGLMHLFNSMLFLLLYKIKRFN